jgi:hypothetical protein
VSDRWTRCRWYSMAENNSVYKIGAGSGNVIATPNFAQSVTTPVWVQFRTCRDHLDPGHRSALQDPLRDGKHIQQPREPSLTTEGSRHQVAGRQGCTPHRRCCAQADERRNWAPLREAHDCDMSCSSHPTVTRSPPARSGRCSRSNRAISAPTTQATIWPASLCGESHYRGTHGAGRIVSSGGTQRIAVWFEPSFRRVSESRSLNGNAGFFASTAPLTIGEAVRVVGTGTQTVLHAKWVARAQGQSEVWPPDR